MMSMNNIQKMRQTSRTAGEFAKGYLGYLSQLLKKLDVSKIQEFIEALETARRNGQTVFFAGNGGSATTASHMANDLGIDPTAMDGHPPLRAVSLSDNLSVITAIANDRGYEQVFTDQLKSAYRPGDLLLLISASGNSPNLVAAANWVKSRGGKVFGFLGFDGGKLRGLCDLSIVVDTPKGEYGPVEDIHMVLDHIIYSWLRFGKRKGEAGS